ncbi:hypothetical protein CCACVL1_16609 [Corchorus capsularis]|uniref:Uncharacterized protein n=1 Tax=Corchorus capsularis TaxID=210143 RepID=A0A1R3HW41_COCAP|nr:hypothetical protein CCACVL1_16609 [Corchorus capsularis]
MAPNLETLILEGCIQIVDLHPSIGFLRRLKVLNLRACKSLRRLPTKIGMKSLETLILSGCSNLERLPDQIDGEMECLVELSLDGTGIRDLPSVIGHLMSGLVLLNLKGCRNLASLPSSINGLNRLKTLNLAGCSNLENLPESLQQVESLEELDLSETAITKPPSFIFQMKSLKFLSFRGCKGPPPCKSRPNLLSLFTVMQRGGSLNSVALTLPPLSGLTSLTELDISYCNLGEGAIPNDICHLSSLKTLDLCGNNFISLPANLDRLSNLKHLALRHCTDLKSLPELLRSTYIPSVGLFANATVCNSIEYASIHLTNCYRIAKNTNVVTLLMKHLKAWANLTREMSIILPGSEIPEWFSHQRDGCSIKMPLPHHLRNDSRFIGVAFCCVFINAVTIRCNRLNGECGLTTEHAASITKDHLWLKYWSFDNLNSSFLKDKCGETSEHSSSLESDVLEFEGKVDLSKSSKGIVKKCGVRIVYEEDLEDMEQIIKGHQIPRIDNTLIEDTHQPQEEADESETGGMGARALLVKRKRNFYEESESGTDSIEERPQPKRLQQFLNCIMRKKL